MTAARPTLTTKPELCQPFCGESADSKAIGFDRAMPEPEFDSLDLAPTGTQPVAVHGATRHGGARNQQAPRRPIPR
jgi:hypothetical protein